MIKNHEMNEIKSQITMRDGRVFDVEGLLDKIRDIKTADREDEEAEDNYNEEKFYSLTVEEPQEDAKLKTITNSDRDFVDCAGEKVDNRDADGEYKTGATPGFEPRSSKASSMTNTYVSFMLEKYAREQEM